MNKCPHDNTELELDKTGALVCPRCHCVFRVCLVRYEPKCYAKQYPHSSVKQEQKERKKRGRPKDPIKVLHESMEENKEVLEALSHGHLKRRGRPRKIKEEVS
jgi:uncharacterized Zn finger protein (UPF0148 family)